MRRTYQTKETHKPIDWTKIIVAIIEVLGAIGVALIARRPSL